MQSLSMMSQFGVITFMSPPNLLPLNPFKRVTKFLSQNTSSINALKPKTPQRVLILDTRIYLHNRHTNCINYGTVLQNIVPLFSLERQPTIKFGWSEHFSSNSLSIELKTFSLALPEFREPQPLILGVLDAVK